MRKESENWWKQAEDDFGTAEVCLKNGRFNASAFHSQQAAEKALKALQIQKLGRFDRVHDLLALAGTVNAPAEIMTCCIRLTPYYTVEGFDYPYVCAANRPSRKPDIVLYHGLSATHNTNIHGSCQEGFGGV